MTDFKLRRIICVAFTHGYWVGRERRMSTILKRFLLAVTPDVNLNRHGFATEDGR